MLVVHDGEAWLPTVLEAVGRQTYPHFRLLAVDNGSTDTSRAILRERLDEQSILVADRDLGFGAAVSMALDAGEAREADWVLLIHDDLELDPDALTRLVTRVTTDTRLAIVGPKLVRWEDPRRLRNVGMTIDLTGRADSGLEPDELDQGQRDRPRRVLYVSTAGMLVRRDVLEELGRFDRRFHLFRDDLDLCWRAWIAGHEVEVVPAAAARHVGAASDYERLGQAIHIGPRYFAERNTLATLLKCYGLARLLVVLPLFLLVGIAKVVGFLATRRVSDAWQTVRAWIWNVVHLRETLRLRREVQRLRATPDGELRPLFGRVAPRLRAYAEAIADRVTGGSVRPAPPPPDAHAAPLPAWQRAAASVAQRPIATTALVLGVLALVSALPLLVPGTLRGGDFAPWPASPAEFLHTYGSGWNHAGDLGSSAAPSPAQLLLGLLGYVALGSQWLAPRLLLLGALPVGWLLALVAGRVVTVERGPRLAGATLYVLSPPALAALATGRLGGLVTVALLPGLAHAVVRLADPRGPSTRAWRATAIAALLAAVVVAFEPPFLLLLAGAAGIGLVAVAAVDAPASARRQAAARILVATIGVVALLFPWSLTFIGAGTPIAGGLSPVESAPSPYLSWFGLVPDLPGFPAGLVGLALPAAGIVALVVGFSVRPRLTAALWATALVAVTLAWAVGRAGDDAWLWPGLLLLVAAIAYAGLLVVGVAAARLHLGAFSFGWRQVVSGGAAVAVVLGMVGAATNLVREDWGVFVAGQNPLPAFLASQLERVGPYRVLVLAEDEQAITWELVGPHGPSMVRYGASEPASLLALVRRGVEEAVTGTSPGASARFGLANVRYVYVPEVGRTPLLERSLRDQLGLEPEPVEAGLVFRVAGWAPRASVLGRAATDSVTRRAELPPDAEPQALEVAGEHRFEGSAQLPGSILLAEAADPGWRAEADGVVLDRSSVHGLVRFTLPSPAENVTVHFAHQPTRSAALAIQGMVAFLALSLVLRPPRFAVEDAPSERLR